MSFTLLDHIDIPDGSLVRRVALYEGDLTAIPKEHSADTLVICKRPAHRAYYLGLAREKFAH